MVEGSASLDQALRGIPAEDCTVLLEHDLGNMVLPAVAHTAQGQQVVFGVVATAAASIDVMDVQLSSATARLTPPTVAR